MNGTSTVPEWTGLARYLNERDWYLRYPNERDWYGTRMNRTGTLPEWTGLVRYLNEQDWYLRYPNERDWYGTWMNGTGGPAVNIWVVLAQVVPGVATARLGPPQPKHNQ